MSADIIDRVVASGNCIGCGACAFAAPERYRMRMTPEGHWCAERRAATAEAAPAICPMAGTTRDESAIAAELYGELPEDGQIGRHRSTFAAYVDEDDLRARGGSGGLLSWVLIELLRRGEVDAVLHVRPTAPGREDGLLFRYAVSESVAEILAGAKSRYYPVEMSEVLRQVDAGDRRYAVVGLPCFIKAVRLLQDEGRLSRAKTPFCIGLVCGHLKSRYFADYLAWQTGADPSTLSAFDFRYKLMDRNASSYGFAYWQGDAGTAAPTTVRAMATVRGGDWGEGLFKNPACEFCDDVLAECADLAVGDAWLPEHVGDPRGTNIVVTRHPRIDQLIRDGAERGAVTLLPADVGAVVQSQASGLRHRREGLAHRLARRRARGEWAPRKRVAPRPAPVRLRGLIYDLRLRITRRSSPLFAEVRRQGAPLATFERRMAPLLWRYRVLVRVARVARKLARRR
jgi:coenzyme F420-reducing hydrogenase beta subunit